VRISCLDCARKHVAQAECLLQEARLGYPLHLWLAVGHLAEAEAETLSSWPYIAALIREHRILLIAEPSYKVPTMRLLEALCDEVQGDGLSDSSHPSEDVL